MKDLPRFLYALKNLNEIVLDLEESKHCIKALRFKAGDRALLLNGLGNNFIGEFKSETKGLAKFIIIENAELTEQRPQLSIAVAPTKNIGRFETFVEKATEYGVGKIMPLHTAHSERPRINVERLNRIALSAMKQSERDFIPEIVNIVSLKDWSIFENYQAKFIAHCREGEKKEFSQVVNNALSTVVLIGPEGDFSVLEVEMALNNGFEAVSLGKSRLRTESAALAVSVLYNL
jgi:16S rRNA (uracil1498-N3)-methyltransferase